MERMRKDIQIVRHEMVMQKEISRKLNLFGQVPIFTYEHLHSLHPPTRNRSGCNSISFIFHPEMINHMWTFYIIAFMYRNIYKFVVYPHS